MFKNRFGGNPPQFSDPGEVEHIIYSRQIDEHGVPILVPTGLVNIPDEINSHAESVDIHNILSRYMSGDSDVLNARVVNYFDATQLPNNLADMYRLVHNGEEYFNKLPVEVRAEFNHSFTEFISSIGTEHFDNVFASKSTESEVTADES